MNFIYVTKQRHIFVDCTEVAVTYIRALGKDKECDFKFSFNQNIVDKVFRNVDYLVAAYDTDCPNKIWLKESTKDMGYKLVEKSNKRKTLTPTGLARVVDNPESFIGDYQLMYDHQIKMWYIDRTEKIK